MIRVLVVEDSPVSREYLVHLLGQDPRLEVVGVAGDGVEALEETERLKPDLILMDIHMPRVNGYEAARQIMERRPTPIVMMTASTRQDEVTMSFEALRAGALTLLGKPGGPDHPDQVEAIRQFVGTVALMAEVKVIRRWPRRERPEPISPPVKPGTIRIIAIAASTGGPTVVADILRKLPADLGAPILLVQHIAPGFTSGLCEWLGHETRLAVTIAEAGMSARPGTVCLAPNGSQMGVTSDGRIRLAQEPAENGFCPSASYLFESVAKAYGRSAMGILLTGMGRDGATGLRRLREAGGITIAQNEESSVIFGMPGEAIRLGGAEYVLSPEEISWQIRSRVIRK